MQPLVAKLYVVHMKGHFTVEKREAEKNSFYPTWFKNHVYLELGLPTMDGKFWRFGSAALGRTVSG